MNCYVHSVPGRLRLKNPLFKNSTVHYDVQKALVNMGHGIGTADFNATTGSLLIHYNPAEIHHQDILSTLERAGFYHPEKTVTNDQVVRQATTKAIKVVTKAVSGAFIEMALQGTGLSFLTILL
jgi:Heavy metal associated domain 2